MNMIALAVKFQKLPLKFKADVTHDLAHVVQNALGKDNLPVFCHEDQMNVQIVNTMPAVTNICCVSHRPRYNNDHADRQGI